MTTRSDSGSGWGSGSGSGSPRMAATECLRTTLPGGWLCHALTHPTAADSMRAASVACSQGTSAMHEFARASCWRALNVGDNFEIRRKRAVTRESSLPCTPHPGTPVLLVFNALTGLSAPSMLCNSFAEDGLLRHAPAQILDPAAEAWEI